MTDKQKKARNFGLGAILLAVSGVVAFEGVSLITYDDPVGIPTACVGETSAEIVMQERFTRDECMALLGASMIEHAQKVSECVHVPVKPNEAAAIISWTYNVGTGAACKSTLIRKLNAGAPAEQWCAELHRWNKAGGKVWRGLVLRRQKEFNMCLYGKWDV